MSLPAAYIAVVLVWSTTPLGVQWSSEGLSPVTGAMSRMVLAALLGWVVCWAARIPVPSDKKSLRIYGISNIGLFAGLMCVYIGAAYIPSGLISVLFGLSPVVSAILARQFLPEPEFTISQWIAVILGLSGLLVTFSDDISWSENSSLGMGLVVFGMMCFSLSNVLIKREQVSMHPLSQTVGSLTLAAILYSITAAVFGIEVNSPQPKALFAILYLTIFGSFIGFFCYYYILKHMAASRVALVTLMTPVIAIALGVWFNGEELTSHLVVGAILICSGLFLFYWGDRWARTLQILKRSLP